MTSRTESLLKGWHPYLVQDIEMAEAIGPYHRVYSPSYTIQKIKKNCLHHKMINEQMVPFNEKNLIYIFCIQHS